ncbi:MAG TPA: UxaA family hydrolase, partial [Phototrophicaceae bacterium]|nr:UxaA family hydrolase [Phototrophicaceae bacterium]
MKLDFEHAGRLPTPGDNVAIATRILPAGTSIHYRDCEFTLSHTILEGHRFAIQPIAAGELLTSWGQAFGRAIVAIQPGDYVRNEGVLKELSRRSLDFTLPEKPNFIDQIAPFVFDEVSFQPYPADPLYPEILTFEGFRRSGGRGVGTRNTIVLLGTSALTGGFVQALESRLKSLTEKYLFIDGIVAAAHTEGGNAQPNNLDLLLRTLAGFAVNPNVGAV